MSPVIPAHAGRLRYSLQALIVSVWVILILIAPAGARNAADESAGERLYREGMLPSSRPLRGYRAGAGSIEGSDAACVHCHRPSGFGSTEGRSVIPPVTAKYLFHARTRQKDKEDTQHGSAAVPDRSAYTDATLARAIREGVGPDGRPLDYLMPRYKLDDATMASLIAYLKSLSGRRQPGVTDDTMHFATIIAPDSDPVKKQAMLDVLDHYFAAKNTLYRPRVPLLRGSERVRPRILRKWQLHVWQLEGNPETWKAQLHKRLLTEPVFAVISGIAGRNWEPVHEFCQEESIPCLLPNVELPVVKESDFYNVYFSRGVLLEADLIAQKVREQVGKSERARIIQVYRADDIGAEASRELCIKVEPVGFRVLNHALGSGDSIQSQADFLKGAGQDDVVVFWLRPKDLKGLPPDVPTRATLYFSGVMGGLENVPLSGGWRVAAQITYPLELPERRAVLLNYPLGWFRWQRINLVAERTQVDTYVACSILSENLDSMHDDLVRDYLLERTEDMLSSRLINGFYTRLGLAAGQRFASKGGYIVRLSESGRAKVTAEGDWIVPSLQ